MVLQQTVLNIWKFETGVPRGGCGLRGRILSLFRYSNFDIRISDLSAPAPCGEQTEPPLTTDDGRPGSVLARYKYSRNIPVDNDSILSISVYLLANLDVSLDR